MAKPSDWNTMTREQKQDYARVLLNSFRGRYIIGQALYEAAQVMSQRGRPEVSNIEDMEVLSELFIPLIADPAAKSISQFSQDALDQYTKEEEPGIKV